MIHEVRHEGQFYLFDSKEQMKRFRYILRDDKNYDVRHIHDLVKRGLTTRAIRRELTCPRLF